MTSEHTPGIFQPGGRRVVGPKPDPMYVAQTIVHLADSDTVFDINIICAYLFLGLDPLAGSRFC